MKLIDNQTILLGDDLKREIKRGSKLRIAASCFSIYAFHELKRELEGVEELRFIFSSPAFANGEVAEKFKKEKREFFLPNEVSENSIYGTEFEVRLRNKLSQKAIARECAEWIKGKAKFKSNTSGGAMQPHIAVDGTLYHGVNGFTVPDLGYEQDNALTRYIFKTSDESTTREVLKRFDEIWNDNEKLVDITDKIVEHISTAYNENAPEYIYFIALYNIFTEFLDDLTVDYLPQEATGFKNSIIWNKLFNFQRDGAVGIINKLEKYNGCILADSVGLGKTFTALAVMQYYSLKNRSILVLCPKRLADNWNAYKSNTKTNVFYKDRIRFDVFFHTDLGRSGWSNGVELDKINWGNYDLVVIDESHNFRNINPEREKESRYDFLMNHIMREGVNTKVLMLSATPVNNLYNDLRNQLALAYAGDYEAFNDALSTEKNVQEIFRRAQAIFNAWSKLPPEQRRNADLIDKLDLDFRTLLDSVTIARSRKNITKYYDIKDIGNFPRRRKPLSYKCELTDRTDVIRYKEIYERIRSLTLSVYAPFAKIFPSAISKYIQDFDLGSAKVSGADMASGRETGIKKLMTVNLLKRLESSCESFRITLKKLIDTNAETLKRIDDYKNTGASMIERTVNEYTSWNPDDDDENFELSKLNQGKKIQIDLKDVDCVSWRREIETDIFVLRSLLFEMEKITVAHDSKLKQLKEIIADKISNPFNAGNKKLLIFSAFADTTTYLYDNLAPWIKAKYGLESAKVQGGESDNQTTVKGIRKVSLSNIITTTREVTDRLLFLDIIHDLVYTRLGSGVKERTQFHKMIERNLWIFGDTYKFGTSDRALKNILEEHIKDLERNELQPTVPDEAADNMDLIPDLCLWNQQRRDDTLYENLVVELKRPNKVLGRKEFNQIKDYAKAVASNAGFDKSNYRWRFILIGKDYDSTLTSELAMHRDEYIGNCRVSVLKWSELITNMRFRYQFYKDKIQLDPTNEMVIKQIDCVFGDLFVSKE